MNLREAIDAVFDMAGDACGALHPDLVALKRQWVEHVREKTVAAIDLRELRDSVAEPSKTADQQARFVAPKFDLESVTRVDPRGHRWREFLLEDYSLGVQSWQECLCGAARVVELPEAVYSRSNEFYAVLDEHPDRRRVSRGPHPWLKRLNGQSVAPCSIGESEWVRAEKLTAGVSTRIAIDCALNRHSACSGQQCCCGCHFSRP